DLVFPEQIEHAARELVGGLARARDHALEVDAHFAGLDSVLLAGAANRLHRLGRVEQRLRRDASPVQTHAARPIALDDRNLHLELAGADRCDVAAGPGTDHGQIVLDGGHFRSAPAGLPDFPESAWRPAAAAVPSRSARRAIG